jgi:hypothetical protein
MILQYSNFPGQIITIDVNDSLKIKLQTVTNTLCRLWFEDCEEELTYIPDDISILDNNLIEPYNIFGNYIIEKSKSYIIKYTDVKIFEIRNSNQHIIIM